MVFCERFEGYVSGFATFCEMADSNTLCLKRVDIIEAELENNGIYGMCNSYLYEITPIEF